MPKILNPYGAEAGNRLEMAEWLAHPDNSLTARVFVNRVFSELFGNGIVQTLGDFGSSGLPPTNLALLDHLAIAFREDRPVAAQVTAQGNGLVGHLSAGSQEHR